MGPKSTEKRVETERKAVGDLVVNVAPRSLLHGVTPGFRNAESDANQDTYLPGRHFRPVYK